MSDEREQKTAVLVLYGASTSLYSGTSYGSRVDGCSMVRCFDVVDETTRSYILRGGFKVPKAAMVYDTGSFRIDMFLSQAEAVNSLKVKG